MIDPILELAHDHRELNGLLVAVHEALSRVERGRSRLEDELHEIRDGVEAFREALLEHFAVEQEALLPFVVARLPAMQARADGIIADHEQIAEVLTAVLRDLAAAEAGGGLGEWSRRLASLEELYASHTKTELAFLQDVASSLASDRTATEQLRSLLDHT